MKLTVPLCLLFMLAVLVGVPTAVVAETVVDAQGVVIKADVMTHDQELDVIRASGAVHIEWQGMTMMSVEAEYNRETQMVVATGSVVLIKGADILRGDKLTLDTVSGKGELDNGTMFLRQGGNFHVAAQHVRKTGEADYEMDQGTITTCDAETPSWKFGDW